MGALWAQTSEQVAYLFWLQESTLSVLQNFSVETFLNFRIHLKVKAFFFCSNRPITLYLGYFIMYKCTPFIETFSTLFLNLRCFLDFRHADSEGEDEHEDWYPGMVDCPPFNYGQVHCHHYFWFIRCVLVLELKLRQDSGKTRSTPYFAAWSHNSIYPTGDLLFLFVFFESVNPSNLKGCFVYKFRCRFWTRVIRMVLICGLAYNIHLHVDGGSNCWRLAKYSLENCDLLRFHFSVHCF